MTLRVAINGFGRIGRNVLRAWQENPRFSQQVDIVAINDIGSLESLAHLLSFDSTHGQFKGAVVLSDGGIKVDDHFISVSHVEDPRQCPWKALDIDLVIESTGLFRAREDASMHLSAGAKKVLLAAVAFDEVDATVVYGVNENLLQGGEHIISAASCTTHCIAPVLKVLDDAFNIEAVSMTEMHAYTSDQHILDHVHRDLRRARAGAQNMIPTTSSSIAAVQKVLPNLENKIMGYSMRVPINNVAAVDLTIRLKQDFTLEGVHSLFMEYKDKDILGFSELPLVSSDFNHRSESGIFDEMQSQSIGNSLKILVWYDNEWGYANRLLDLISYLKTSF